MEKLIVDRIEEGIAVLEKEDGAYVKMQISDFDFCIREGSILTFDGEKYSLRKDEDEERRSRILALQRKLSQKGKKE